MRLCDAVTWELKKCSFHIIETSQILKSGALEKDRIAVVEGFWDRKTAYFTQPLQFYLKLQQ